VRAKEQAIMKNITEATSKFNELISPANLYDKNLDGEIADSWKAYSG
jgi:hypothetical protein